MDLIEQLLEFRDLIHLHLMGLEDAISNRRARSRCKHDFAVDKLNQIYLCEGAVTRRCE